MWASLNQSCFPGITTERFLAIAAEAGADGVELRLLGAKEPPGAMAAAARASALKIVAVNALMDWALPTDPDPIPEFERFLELAVTAGSPLVVCVAPIIENVPPPPAEIHRSAVERFSQLAEAARPTGVRVALEQVGVSSTRPWATSGIRSLAAARAIVSECGEDVMLCIDNYNLLTGDVVCGELSQLPAGRIGIAQLADRDPVSRRRALPGDGDLDLRRWVRAVEATGYAGALSVETFPTKPWRHPAHVAQRAVQALRSLLDSEELVP